MQASASIPAHFHIPFQPIADPNACVHAPGVRFTVLTSRLLRLEASPTGAFEDHPSQVFWYRRQPVPPFQVRRSESLLEIITEHLHLRYKATPRGFGPSSLSIELCQGEKTWHYSDHDDANLKGTIRTLDNADGEVRLPEGLLSRSGWSLVDDSSTLIFNPEGWLENRPNPGGLDLYFFGYGHDYLGCLADYCKLSGQIPLIPRWALGNWWSRYWAYTQEELTQLMKDFRSKEIPLSVCVIDMDWHITSAMLAGVTQTGNQCSGWTGYTWNRQLFPDPPGFLAWLHAQGLRTTLNVHPAEGVHPHEQPYAEMAARMGIDPKSNESVEFDIADPRFANAYFEVLHHPQEADGVDFWWIDWQQGVLTRLPGLDPLYMLNHLHYYDRARDTSKRPFVFSRWPGLGGHRYQIGFSGDTWATWESLAFQPYFTATASNVAYAWWSHDIGGHQRGGRDPELYARWVQYGVFSPILRLHSTNNPYMDRRPWGHGLDVLQVTRAALQLRHALIPYLYSMAYRCSTHTQPLIQPMYYHYPEVEDAYHCPNQYYFGSELIAAPYVSRRDPSSGLSRQSVWLPEGEWFDFFSGERYAGNRWKVFYGGLEDIPVLARAGAILPLAARVGWGGVANPAELEVHLFPGADAGPVLDATPRRSWNTFELYEDSGEGQDYLQGKTAKTRLRQEWHTNSLEFHIDPLEGDAELVPAVRTYTLHLHGVRKPDALLLSLNGAVLTPKGSYDESSETLVISGFKKARKSQPLALTPTDRLDLLVRVNHGVLLGGRDRRREHCLRMLRSFDLDTDVCRWIEQALPDLLAGRASLEQYARYMTESQLHALESVIK